MPDSLFHIDTRLPFSRSPGPAPAEIEALLLGSRLLLRTVNQMEMPPGHGERHEPACERLEAKLDLLLHWLGRNLYGSQPRADEAELRLDAEGVAWPGQASPGETLVLNLYLHPALAAPLQLPARVSAVTAGQVRAEFLDLDEELRDLWSQWLFRRHRRAIQAAREGG
jgi:hypothetical protein